MAEPKELSGRQRTWRRVAQTLLVAMVFCWAVTVYCLAPAKSFLWDPTTRLTPFGPDLVRLKTEERFEGIAVTYTDEDDENEMVTLTLADGLKKTWLRTEIEKLEIRHVPIRPMLLVAAAFFVSLSWFLLRLRKGKLDFWKSGQGLPVRVSAYGMLLALSIFGAYTLYYAPAYQSYWRTGLVSTQVLGIELALRPILFPSVGSALLAMLIVHLLLNRAGWSNFLIETEGELKKVSWPPRKEFVGSSIVVLLVTVSMALFLAAVDWGLSRILKGVGGF